MGLIDAFERFLLGVESVVVPEAGKVLDTYSMYRVRAFKCWLSK